MNEEKHFHHFLNMIRNIHDAIIATNVMSDKVAQSVEAHGVGDNIKKDNILSNRKIADFYT